MLSFDSFVSENFMDPKALGAGVNKIISLLNSKGYSFSRFGGANYAITFVKTIAGGSKIKSTQIVYVSPTPDGPCLTFNVEANRSHQGVASVNFYSSYDGSLSHPEFEIVNKGKTLTNLAKALLVALKLNRGDTQGDAVGPIAGPVTEVRRDASGRIADPERRQQHISNLKNRFEEVIDELQLYDINVNEVLSQTAINVSDEVPADTPEIDAMVQYGDLKHAVRSLVSGEHKCVFVAGSAGVGKTYNVISELKELGTPFRSVTGSVTSEKAVYDILFNNRHDGKVLLVDDCDSFFNPANVNILKGALGENNGEDYRCSYVSSATLDVTKWPPAKVDFYTQLYDAQKSADEALFDELAARINIIRGGGEEVNEAADFDEEDEMEDGPKTTGAYFPKEIMKAIEKGRQLAMPSSFVFEARVIFITNIPPENFRRDPHLKALLDRGELVPIVMNQNQVFSALGKLLPHLKHQKVILTNEQKKELLDVVMSWYKKNKPEQSSFPSFRTFVLLFPHRNSGGDWQAYVERALKNKAG